MALSPSSTATPIVVPTGAQLDHGSLQQLGFNSAIQFSATGTPAFSYNNGSGGAGSAVNASLIIVTPYASGNAFALQMSTGTSPVANGSIGVFTFASAYANAPAVTIDALNQVTANTPAYGANPLAVTTAGFQLNNAGGALVGSTVYKWLFTIVG